MQEKVLSTKEKADLEKVKSMWRIVFSQFLDHRMAVVGMTVIIAFIIIALTAPLIKSFTGLDPERQNPLSRYQPTMSRSALPSDQREDIMTQFENSHSADLASLRNEIIQKGFVNTTRPEDALFEMANKDLAESKAQLAQLSSPLAQDFKKTVLGFEELHLFGTDELGRDVFIRLVYGTRVSMGVGVMVAIFSALIGLLIGSFAGYYGGFVDTLLMRATDALLSLPILPFLIVMAAIDMNKVPLFRSLMGSENESIVKMVIILLLFSWMTTARLVRASILSLREREFILAAKTLGARDSTIIFRHMFPNVIAPMLVSVTLGVGSSILFESALSFLGLGIQQPTPSWGNMLFNAQDLITEAPFLAIIPGLLILIVTMSFNYLGDGLQDAIDPKAIRR